MELRERLQSREAQLIAGDRSMQVQALESEKGDIMDELRDSIAEYKRKDREEQALAEKTLKEIQGPSSEQILRAVAEASTTTSPRPSGSAPARPLSAKPPATFADTLRIRARFGWMRRKPLDVAEVTVQNK